MTATVSLRCLGRALLFARLDLLDQFRRADDRLKLVMVYAEDIAKLAGYRMLWTSLERDFEDTQEIYRKAGKQPPAGRGVHDVRPVRGADGVPQILTSDPAMVSRAEIGEWIAERVNKKFAYGVTRPQKHTYKAALWHDVQGAHLHLQVPWDALGILPMASSSS